MSVQGHFPPDHACVRASAGVAPPPVTGDNSLRAIKTVFQRYRTNAARRMSCVLRAAALPALLCACAPPPGPPQALELVGVLHDENALRRPHDVELSGDIAFVPGKGGSLALIDISDPAQPTLLSALTDLPELEDAEAVLPLGETLLVGTRDFLSVDVSDPRQPKVLKTIGDRERIDKINGMVKIGDFVFTANKIGFIGVFDVSEPRDPRLVDAFDARTHGQMSPHDIAQVDDSRIIVVDTGRGTAAAVQVYRVFDDQGRLAPVSEWTADGRIPSHRGTRLDIEGANRVAVSGRVAYLGAFVPDRVSVVDLSNPAEIFQTANLPVCDIDATGMTIVGKALFVSGGECVEAIDVSDPAHPVSIAQYRNGDLFPSREVLLEGEPRYDNGHDLVYRSGYLYVSAQNDARFGVLRVNHPRALELTQ